MHKPIHISVHRGFFVVTTHDHASKGVVMRYRDKMKTFRWEYDKRTRRNIKKVGYVFAAKMSDRDEFRFNATFLSEFVNFLEIHGYPRTKFTYDIVEYPEPAALDVRIKPGFEKRKHQIPYVEGIVNNKRYQSMVDLQTGKGKTAIAMFAICELNELTGIMVKPKYIKKWKSDLLHLTDVDEKDIAIVKGMPSLVKLMKEVRTTGKRPKFTIFSNRTMFIFVKKWLAGEVDPDGPFTPDDIMPTLGISTMLIDEVHEEFYSVFMNTMFYDTYRLIALSATLDSNNASIKAFHKALFPLATRLSFEGYHRYVTVHAVGYLFNDTKPIRCVTNQGYSHVEFEQSIMRKPQILSHYLSMVGFYIQEGYLKDKQPGDTCLVFASTVKMCTIMVDWFRTEYPSLNITRYVEDDPYELLMEGDIVFSTVMSAGTAIDKSNLTTVIQTISIKSIVSNSQTLGRLREIKGRDLKYYYLYSRSIPKHIEYHNEKIEQYGKKAKKIVLDDYHRRI